MIYVLLQITNIFLKNFKLLYDKYVTSSCKSIVTNSKCWYFLAYLLWLKMSDLFLLYLALIYYDKRYLHWQELTIRSTIRYYCTNVFLILTPLCVIYYCYNYFIKIFKLISRLRWFSVNHSWQFAQNRKKIPWPMHKMITNSFRQST